MTEEKLDESFHDSIRNGNRYKVYLERDGWLVWSEVTARGHIAPFVMFCHEDEGCFSLPEVEPELMEAVENDTFELDRADGNGSLEVDIELIVDALKKHDKHVTKQEVARAL